MNEITRDLLEQVANLHDIPQGAFNIRENGGLIQVNAHAFSQRPCRKLLKFLLRNDMLDFVASDCHRAEGRNVDFTAAKAYVRKRFPNQYEKLFGDNGKIFRR